MTLINFDSFGDIIIGIAAEEATAATAVALSITLSSCVSPLAAFYEVVVADPW